MKKLPSLGLFRKPKKVEQEEKPVLTIPPEKNPAEAEVKTYLKAMPLRDLADLEPIKSEVKNGNPKRTFTYSSLKVSKIPGTTVLIPTLLSIKLARFIILDFSP